MFYRFLIRCRAVLAMCLAYVYSCFTTSLLAASTTIDAKWMTAVLRRRGIIDDDCTVVTAKIVDMGVHRGLANAMRKIELDLFDSSKAEGDLSDGEAAYPKHLIIKSSHPTLHGRELVLHSGSVREANLFSSSLVQTFLELDLVDKPVYTGSSSLLGEYVLVMLDLNRLPGATPFNKLMGDQVFGSGCPDVPAAIQLLEKLFSTIAKVHAKHWCQEQLMQETWLKAVLWRQGKNRENWQACVEFAKTSWASAKRKHSFMHKDLVQLVDRTLASSTFDDAVAHLQRMKFTLAHGDFHASNMFHTDSGFKLVDWSEIGIGEPAAEIGQCLVSDLHHTIFAKHGDALLRVYWQALVANGVQDYDFEQCRQDFARGTVERWIYFLTLLADMEGLPEKLVRYFHDQLHQFVLKFGDINATYTFKSVYGVI